MHGESELSNLFIHPYMARIHYGQIVQSAAMVTSVGHGVKQKHLLKL